MCKTTTTVNRLSQFEQADPLRRSPELLALTVAVVKSEVWLLKQRRRRRRSVRR